MLRHRNLARQSAPEAETRRGRSPKSRAAVISVRALHAREGDKDIYAFFMPGCQINRIADIIRVSRDESDTPRGFQRKEIRDHLRSRVPSLFPNAIALALSSEVCFIQSRGSTPPSLATGAREGILSIPLRAEGEPVGWLVDGQQRPLALVACKDSALPVPVVAFVTNRVQLNREQFILVNKTRPLPGRLINELLPETGDIVLLKDRASQRIPGDLCNYLAREKRSPFRGLIRRLSDSTRNPTAVVTDTAIVKMIRNSINNPLGALAPTGPLKTKMLTCQRCSRSCASTGMRSKRYSRRPGALPPPRAA